MAALQGHVPDRDITVLKTRHDYTSMTLQQHTNTHAQIFPTHGLNEVFVNLVKSFLLKAFHSNLSSQHSYHTLHTTGLKGRECPVHSQHIPIKDLWGINGVVAFLQTSYGFQVTSRLKSLAELQSWNSSRLMIQIKVAHVFIIIRCNP